MKLRAAYMCKGVSSFVAFTVLLAISSAIAIYIYAYSTDLYTVYKPRQSYTYGYVVCYNISGLEAILLRNVALCRTYLDDLSDTKYLCVFRIGLKMNLTVVYRDYVENLFIDRSCVALFRELPLKVFRNSGDTTLVLEVKVYDPWSK